MENDSEILEEGEILDDDYTPLERPQNYSTTVPHRLPMPVQQDSESEELQSASESDSDSDTKCYQVKKPKLKPTLKARKQAPRRKKYDIWSTRVQEEVLAETLNSCDVTVKDRSRSVESYDYTLGQKLHRTNNKRNRNDRSNANFKQLKRSSSNEEGDVKSCPRKILDLAVTLESSEEEIASDMANKLCEEKEDLLLKIVTIAGKEKSFQIFEETKRIEAEGGMLIMNQTRRRTPGGVFLFLLRHDDNLAQEKLNQIFDEDRQKFKEASKKKQKEKARRMKAKIQLSSAQNKNLPELLTRAELCVQKLAAGNDRSRKESEHLDVVNPPPTPETDCHDNSGDGMDGDDLDVVNKEDSLDSRKIENYDVDFLDLGCGNKMDLF